MLIKRTCNLLPYLSIPVLSVWLHSHITCVKRPVDFQLKISQGNPFSAHRVLWKGNSSCASQLQELHRLMIQGMLYYVVGVQSFILKHNRGAMIVQAALLHGESLQNVMEIVGPSPMRHSFSYWEYVGLNDYLLHGAMAWVGAMAGREYILLNLLKWQQPTSAAYLLNMLHGFGHGVYLRTYNEHLQRQFTACNFFPRDDEAAEFRSDRLDNVAERSPVTCSKIPNYQLHLACTTGVYMSHWEYANTTAFRPPGVIEASFVPYCQSFTHFQIKYGLHKNENMVILTDYCDSSLHELECIFCRAAQNQADQRTTISALCEPLVFLRGAPDQNISTREELRWLACVHGTAHIFPEKFFRRQHCDFATSWMSTSLQKRSIAECQRTVNDTCTWTDVEFWHLDVLKPAGLKLVTAH